MIATRESRLALWQAHHVQQRLQSVHAGCTVELLGLTTTGDRILDRPLAAIGGKGLFTKELEQALADSRADLAVHSLKDVPMQLPEGFTLAAVLERADPRDALVSSRFGSLRELPPGARVGTSSLRRAAQLSDAFPQIQVLPLRGNVDTRLAKLDRGEYDAVVLAAAGLKRLGLAHRIRELLAPSLSLPAPGQGALGIEVRAGRDELLQWLAPLAHRRTWLETTAERAVSRALGGSCRVPLAAYAVQQPDGTMRLDAMLAVDGEPKPRRAGAQAPVADFDAAAELGERVAAALAAPGGSKD